MPISLMIAAVLAHAACTALAIYWSIGLGRLIATVRRHPTARAGTRLPLPQPVPRVRVVVPAHNEAAVVGRLVASLRAQDYPAFTVALALDRCTDQTESVARAAIADDRRFEIIRVESCPDGWAGKVHAIWHALHDPARPAPRPDADILLFADADTILAPECLRATVALLTHRGLDMLSLLSTLTHDRWFERVAQPAATIETVTQYPILRASRPDRRRAFANGQFLMLRREAYEAVGGHAGVRDELLEDLALARRIADAGRPAAIVVADGLLVCRMYASWAEFRRGWKRIYIELARRSPGRLLRAAARVAAFGTLMPLAAAANIVGGAIVWAGGEAAWGAAGVAFGLTGLIPMALTLGPTYRVARSPVAAAPAYPIGAAIVAGILMRAGLDLRAGRAVEWAGRRYIRPIAGAEARSAAAAPRATAAP